MGKCDEGYLWYILDEAADNDVTVVLTASKDELTVGVKKTGKDGVPYGDYTRFAVKALPEEGTMFMITQVVDELIAKVREV